jgi:hypothetical protein
MRLNRLAFAGNKAALHGQVLALDEPSFHATVHDLFKELLKEVRLLKASMTVLGKRGVMGNLLIEAESGKPAPGQMHLQFLDQLALAGDAIEIADQQDAQQEFRIDRGSARIAVGVLQLLSNEIEADVPVNETEQVVFRNLIFDAKVVEQRLETGVLSHHNPQASVIGYEEEHRQNAWSYKRCCQHFSLHSRRLFQHPPLFATVIWKLRLALILAGLLPSGP